MANVSKLNLLGNVYNITDKDAQSKIAELEAKVDSIEGSDLSAYETIEGAASKYQPKGDYVTADSAITEDELQEILKSKVDKQDGKGLSTNDYTNADKNTVANLKQLSSISHIKDAGAFTATSDSVKLNFDCVSASAGDGNFTQHSEKIPVASATSAGIITAADKSKLDATPTFWVGTQAEYDALTTKDNKTFYYITEE